jgi:hypothetical protein
MGIMTLYYYNVDEDPELPGSFCPLVQSLAHVFYPSKDPE